MSSSHSSGVQFGRVDEDGHWKCCGKPLGCSIVAESCLYMQHPYKRCTRGEITPAQMTAMLTKPRKER